VTSENNNWKIRDIVLRYAASETDAIFAGSLQATARELFLDRGDITGYAKLMDGLTNLDRVFVPRNMRSLKKKKSSPDLDRVLVPEVSVL